MKKTTKIIKLILIQAESNQMLEEYLKRLPLGTYPKSYIINKSNVSYELIKDIFDNIEHYKNLLKKR